MRTSVALGTFDGVHKGHRAVLSTAVGCGLYTLAVTFELPPKAYFSKNALLLTNKADKTAAIKKLGVDEVVFLDFCEVKELSAIDFFNLLCSKFSPQYLVCGEDYRFGKDRCGDIRILKTLCDENGIDLLVVPPVNENGKPVSSTDIRKLLLLGETTEANRLLDGSFSFEGTVLQGDKRGRTIGFPTANLVYPKDIAPVKNGVYACKIESDGKSYDGICNIGYRPTYKTDTVCCEAYLFDFSGDLYGKTIRIYLNKFIREEQKFSSINQLKNAIIEDCKAAKLCRQTEVKNEY